VPCKQNIKLVFGSLFEAMQNQSKITLGSLVIVKLASTTNLKQEGALGGCYCTTEKSRLLPHACDEKAAIWLWETRVWS
jgi:hypothetical protein